MNQILCMISGFCYIEWKENGINELLIIHQSPKLQLCGKTLSRFNITQNQLHKEMLFSVWCGRAGTEWLMKALCLLMPTFSFFLCPDEAEGWKQVTHEPKLSSDFNSFFFLWRVRCLRYNYFLHEPALFSVFTGSNDLVGLFWRRGELW